LVVQRQNVLAWVAMTEVERAAEDIEGLGRFEITARGEAVHEKVVAKFSGLPAVVGVEVVVIQSGATKVYVAMSRKIGTRTRSDVEHAAETITVFGSESARHQINGFENLRTYSRAELGLGIVQKRDAVDELVQGKFGAANCEKIIVTVEGDGHQIVDEIIRRIGERVRKSFQVPVREGIGTACFLGINGEISRFHFHGLLDGVL